MALIELPVRSDLNAYLFQIDLDGTLYQLEFKYNSRMNLWFMSINNSAGDCLLNGIPLWINYPLNIQYIDDELPPGIFWLINENVEETEAGEDDLGNDVKLFYEEAI